MSVDFVAWRLNPFLESVRHREMQVLVVWRDGALKPLAVELVVCPALHQNYQGIVNHRLELRVALAENETVVDWIELALSPGKACHPYESSPWCLRGSHIGWPTNVVTEKPTSYWRIALTASQW